MVHVPIPRGTAVAGTSSLVDIPSTSRRGSGPCGDFIQNELLTLLNPFSTHFNLFCTALPLAERGIRYPDAPLLACLMELLTCPVAPCANSDGVEDDHPELAEVHARGLGVLRGHSAFMARAA